MSARRVGAHTIASEHFIADEVLAGAWWNRTTLWEIHETVSAAKPLFDKGSYRWRSETAEDCIAVMDAFEAAIAIKKTQEAAAAPDLLAACKALQMEAAARGCGLRIADEAIAKAEGRS